MTDPLERMKQASRLGPLARLRLRAEVLLVYGERGTVPLTADQQEELERISAAPKLEDRDFLGQFDQYLEAEE